MTWEQIQESIAVLYGQYVGAGGFVESSSGTPTALALLANLLHNRILNYPQNFSFLKETTTFALTGATSYDLSVLFPDYRNLYQLFDANENKSFDFAPNYDANIIPLTDGYTVKGKILTFTGSFPTSGTIGIQYKSKYMVKDSTGVRKKFFEDDSDVTVLDDENLLIWGMGEYINWSADDSAKEKRQDVRGWFKEAWTNLFLDNENINQVGSML